MKAIAAALFTLVLLMPVVPANASQTELNDLYQVFNTLFYESGDADRLDSDIELLNSSYFLSNGEDLQFGNPGDTLRIDLTFSEAAFGNELGYVVGETYTSLIEAPTDSDKRRINSSGITFAVPEEFLFADTVTVAGDPMQRWYADAELNPLGQKDHFLAFAIDDQTLLDAFYSLYGIEYTAGLDDVWLIAFEDLNLGDADYTDLVAVVSRPAELNSAPIPTPVPAAVWLLGSGLLGVAGLRKRKE